MKSLAKFFARVSQYHLAYIAAMVIVPVMIPYFFFGIIQTFASGISDVQLDPYDLPSLPGPDGIPNWDQNSVYFSYSPATNQYKAIVEQLLTVNEINANIKAFESVAAADHYFVMKNLHDYSNHIDNDSLWKTVICQDLKEQNCTVDLKKGSRNAIKQQYGLSDEEIDIDVRNDSKYQENILFHINFIVSQEKINNVPMNISYEVVYNQTWVDSLIQQHPDLLSQKFGNNNYQPYWTGYTQTIQHQLDQITLQQYTDIKVDFKYKRLGELYNLVILAQMFFEITVTIAFSVLFILQTMFASAQRGSCHLVLRRLGVKENQFWLCQFLVVEIPTAISMSIAAICWHFTGVMPFASVSIWFSLTICQIIGLLLTVFALVFSQLFKKSTPTILSCFSSLCFLIIPAIFHTGGFQGSTLFDPSFVPQWITWISLVIFPQFSIMGLIDSMTSTQPTSSQFVVLSQYIWKVLDKPAKLSYLFKDNSASLNWCRNTYSVHGIIIDGHCYYHQPMYAYILLIAAFQLLVISLFILMRSYIKNEMGYRGIPIRSLLSNIKSNLRHQVSTKDASVMIQGLNVKYNQKCHQKSRIKHALSQVDFTHSSGQIQAVVGESGAGKSTLMSFIAGELNPLQSKNLSTITEEEEPILENKHLYSLFQKFNLSSSIDASAVKPYIGYLPQDFSNVWMNFTVYDNVNFSRLLRKENQSQPNCQEEQGESTEEILSQMGLGPEQFSKRAKHLSGGMLRRLAFCNSIAGNPKLLLLDEVTSGVDPVLKRQVWRSIEYLASKETSIILSTHDTSEIQEIAQRITVLDASKTLINNESPFDLRVKSTKYSVKFYNENADCNDAQAQEICSVYLKDIVSECSIILPHSIQISINQYLNHHQLMLLCGQLENVTAALKYNDYTLSKAKLDDVYIDIIKYQRHIHSKMDHTPYYDNKKVQNTRFCRFIGMLMKSIKTEFLHQVPPVVLFGLISLILSLVSLWLCSLLNSLFDNVNQSVINQNRLNDLAYPCFQACQNMYPNSSKQDAVQKCFEDRPEILFQSMFTEQTNSNKCGAYANYLGLDQSQNSFMAIGDHRYNDIYAANYHFSFSGLMPDLGSADNISLQSTDVRVNRHASTETLSQNLNYKELYENRFDPAVNKSLDSGLLPFIAPQLVQRQTNQCGFISACQSLCKKVPKEAELCGEVMSESECIAECSLTYNTSECNNNEQLIQFVVPVSIFSDEAEFLRKYRMTLGGEVLNIPVWSKDPDFYQKIGRFFGERQNIANFDIRKAEISLKNTSLAGKMEIEVTSLQPNRGRTGNDYILNRLQGYYVSDPAYKCNGVYENKYDIRNIYMVKDLPAAYRHHRGDLADGRVLQSLPDRDHVRLFDVGNQPMTQLISSILRKSAFQSADEGDYSPWDISYSLTSRPMPFLADGKYVKASDLGTSDLANSLAMGLLTTTALLPMMYAALKIGEQFEANINNLLHLHFVTQTRWILQETLFYVIMSLIPATICLVTYSVIQPDIFYGTNTQRFNLLFFYLQNVEGVISGVFLGCLVKQGKKATLVSFFVILFILCLALLGFGSQELAYIFSVFLPAFSISYEYYLTNSQLNCNLGVLFSGMGLAIVYVGGSVLIANISNMLQSKKNKKENSEEVLDTYEIAQNIALQVHNVEHTYRSGTHALKGVSAEIPRNQVFGLLGSNGSGKSTLMHCLAGIYRPTSGKAWIESDGSLIDLFRCGQVSKYFSMVPQHDIYWPNLSLVDHLNIMQRLNALPHPVNNEKLIAALQLESVKDQQLSSLSGGMKRRVSIALAMSTCPQILALDEPSCGLGVTTKRFVHQAILRVLNGDTTLVLTTHDMEEVESLVDQCCVMNLGTVLATGSVAQLRSQCAVSLELTLRESEGVVCRVAEQLMTVSKQYNAMCDIWTIQLKRGARQRDVLEVLEKEGLLESAWNMDAIRMERVFLDLVENQK